MRELLLLALCEAESLEQLYLILDYTRRLENEEIA